MSSKNASPSPAKKRLVSYLLKHDPALSDTQITKILHDITRFVDVVRKIRTEPQAKVTYSEKKTGKKIVKNRIFTTDLDELAKIPSQSEGLIEKLRAFNKTMHEHDKRK